MTASNDYPKPQRNCDNAPFLDAWSEGRLVYQVCDACRSPVFYPRPMCPHCWSADMSWRQSAGRGTIRSYSIVHKAGHEALQKEVPIAVAEIELDEGFGMIARIVADDLRIVETGARVELVSPDAARRFALPTFACTPASLLG